MALLGAKKSGPTCDRDISNSAIYATAIYRAYTVSSRSFDLDFENRVRSVMFEVLDRLFPYLPQIITTIRGCVACSVYNKILKFKFFTNFSNFFGFHLLLTWDPI